MNMGKSGNHKGQIAEDSSRKKMSTDAHYEKWESKKKIPEKPIKKDESSGNEHAANGLPTKEPTIPANSNAHSNLPDLDSKKGNWLKDNLLYVAGIVFVSLAILYQCEVAGETQLASKTAIIAANRADLFDFVSNLENYNKWFPSHYSIYEADQGPIGVGKTYIATDRLPVIGDDVYDVKIVAYDSMHLIIFNADHWTKTKVEMRFKQYKDKTGLVTVTWTMSTRMSSYLAQVAICPFMKLVYASRARQALFNLRILFRPDSQN